MGYLGILHITHVLKMWSSLVDFLETVKIFDMGKVFISFIPQMAGIITIYMYAFENKGRSRQSTEVEILGVLALGSQNLRYMYMYAAGKSFYFIP